MLAYWIIATVILQLCVPKGVSAPITPAEYQKIIKQGFTTTWFKKPAPISKYNNKNIEDVYSNGFRNLRLRSRADLYTAPYNNAEFDGFLSNLTTVVDKCLAVGVAPIISWIHHKAEACGSDEDRRNYVAWWTAVAKQLKDKDYRLSFNLFTELGIDTCDGKRFNVSCSCNESLRMDRDKYNNWTAEVVKAIRTTGGNNEKRIIILGSPVKTAEKLDEINPDIYKNDSYMMVEWHIYASGPNKIIGHKKYWKGNGTPDATNGRENVRKAIKYATDFTNKTKILTYFAEWMPTDNTGRASLTEEEVIHFARFFTAQLRKEKIPWSLNRLERFYDTEKSEWITGIQNIKGASLNMSKVLETIKSVM